MIQLALLILGLSTSAFAQDAVVAEPTSVSRRVLICERWYMTTDPLIWGCFNRPRAVELADGTATDAVIATLNDRIQKLEERLNKLD